MTNTPKNPPYLLDTHTWIWWALNSEKLSKEVKALLSNRARSEELLLSAISIWEFSKLLEKSRIRISVPGDAWIQRALEIPGLRVTPLSSSICWQSTQLPKPFHDDPADQIIVATAREENAVLITRDELLRDYPHCKTFW